jgi:hypothetical protein
MEIHSSELVNKIKQSPRTKVKRFCIRQVSAGALRHVPHPAMLCSRDNWNSLKRSTETEAIYPCQESKPF